MRAYPNKRRVSLYRTNLGGPRAIPLIGNGEVKVHRSVKIRMGAEGVLQRQALSSLAELREFDTRLGVVGNVGHDVLL